MDLNILEQSVRNKQKTPVSRVASARGRSRSPGRGHGSSSSPGRGHGSSSSPGRGDKQGLALARSLFFKRYSKQIVRIQVNLQSTRQTSLI